MDKKEYLTVREKLSMGNITDKGIELLYEYWTVKKAPEYKELTLEEFKSNFIGLLDSRVFHPNLKRIIDYYDNLYSVTTIIDNKNNVLAFY